MLDTESRIQRTLMNAITRGEDISTLLSELHATTKCALTIVDKTGLLVAKVPMASQEVELAPCDPPSAKEPRLGPWYRGLYCIWPIVVKRLPVAYLIASGEIDEDSEQFLSASVPLIAILLIFNSDKTHEALDNRLATVMDVLAGHPGDGDIDNLLEDAGVDPSQAYRVIHLSHENTTDINADIDADTKGDLAWAICPLLGPFGSTPAEKDKVQACISPDGVSLICLAPDKPQIEDQVHQLSERLTTIGVHMQIGVGGAGVGPLGIRASLLEAQALARGGGGMWTQKRRTISRVLTVPDTVVSTAAREILRPLVHPEANPDILKTLLTYLECNASSSRTAERLVIHRHTLRYRLRRIRELSGFDPYDIGDLMELMLALIVSGLWQHPSLGGVHPAHAVPI